MKRGIHPDNWLAASDFTEDGRTLTISEVKMVEIEPNKSKLVVFFKEEKKGLVLNEVNQKIIERNIGEVDTTKWGGYKITPYASEILFNGSITPCIRVKILVGKLAERCASFSH